MAADFQKILPLLARHRIVFILVGGVAAIAHGAAQATYEQLLPHTTEEEIFGARTRVVTLEKLIQLKRAAGRPKNLEAIAELAALFEERRKGPPR